jgi:hypothetical protein
MRQISCDRDKGNNGDVRSISEQRQASNSVHNFGFGNSNQRQGSMRDELNCKHFTHNIPFVYKVSFSLLSLATQKQQQP